MKAPARALLSSLLLCSAGLLAGCGSPSQSLYMSVKPGDALQLRGFMPAPLRGQVGLAPAAGGAETGRLWGSKISDLALEHALEDSLRAVGLWAMTPQEARYELKAQLVSLVQPLLSLNTTVAATVHYTLVEKASGALLYQRSVRAAYKAEFSEAIVSQPERLKLANEGAIRATTEIMLRDLPNLRF